jgi:sugar-phosphatase
MIKAVIFDMDGLLIDSEPFWHNAHKSVLRQFGHSVSEQQLRNVAGKKTIEIARHWCTHYAIVGQTPETITSQIFDMVIHDIQRDGTLMPGAEELIKMLKAQNIIMAIASSSPEVIIDVVVKKFKIAPYMTAIHSATDEGRGKPFPDVFIATATSLTTEPKACLVLEDSLNGVKAAKAAGMKCIAVPEEGYDKEAYEAAKPDLIVESLEEVSALTIKEME